MRSIFIGLSFVVGGWIMSVVLEFPALPPAACAHAFLLTGAAADEEESTASDASAGDDAEASTSDEAIPMPEPESFDEETKDTAAADSRKDDDKGGDKEEEATTSDADKSDEDKSTPSKKHARGKKESAAPAPPGGTLADRLQLAAAPAKRPEPIEFHGVRAGRTKVDELHKAWGAPLSATKQKQVVRETYKIDKLDRVEVHCLNDTVQSVTVTFNDHPRWKELAAEIELDNIEAVDVHDDFGELMGIALPEAGVIVAFEPKGKERRVTQVIYDEIDPQTFVLRATGRMSKDCVGCEKDIDLALQADPQFARAYWLRARMQREAGQTEAAMKSIDLAVKYEPKNAQYRLTRGALLADSGEFVKAIDETKHALGLCSAQSELKACILNQLGDQLASGPGRDYKKALPLHLEAIKLAEPVTSDRRPAARKMAKEAMVTAHLCAARNIAWGDWKIKKKMVPSWLNRADELAADVEDEEGVLPTELRVCREALTACVGMEGDLDPTPWIEKALSVGTPALDDATDPMRRRQLHWELGSALYDALQVYHATSDTTQAMKYGTLAVEHLEAGAEERQLEPVEAFLLGRLYYRMGAVCAMELKESGKAVVWFERAIPLLERPIPAAALSDAGRHGESFVSMAVSYWADGNHDEAMRLTRQGLKLMQQAVKDGVLDEDALRVPYTNLATMHRYLGDDEQADSFSNMAAKAANPRR